MAYSLGKSPTCVFSLGFGVTRRSAGQKLIGEGMIYLQTETTFVKTTKKVCPKMAKYAPKWRLYSLQDECEKCDGLTEKLRDFF